jgi:predicted lipoprotein with Yx(FWY)xxD motif
MPRPAPLAAVLLVAAVLAGCGSGGGGYGGGGSSSSSKKSSAAAPTGGGPLAVKDTGVGSVLVDGSGRTLYMFERDTAGKSNCSGACAQNWPPAASTTAGSGVAKGKLTTIKRSDGTSQAAYAGHPLYRFSGDQAAGDTNGQGQDAFGGKWYAVSATGSAVKSSSGGGSSGGSSGGGYGSGGY